MPRYLVRRTVDESQVVDAANAQEAADELTQALEHGADPTQTNARLAMASHSASVCPGSAAPLVCLT